MRTTSRVVAVLAVAGAIGAVAWALSRVNQPAPTEAAPDTQDEPTRQPDPGQLLSKPAQDSGERDVHLHLLPEVAEHAENDPPIGGVDPLEKSHTVHNHSRDSLLQVRHDIDLTPPNDFDSALSYAESKEYNPDGVQLSPQQFAALEELLAERQRQMLPLHEDHRGAITEFRDMRLASGQYILGPTPAERGLQEGTVVVFAERHGEPEKMIVMRYGEYAPLDVAVDDMWTHVQNTQKDIKGFFK